MTEEKVIRNIIEIRKEKGISHEAMAMALEISQAAYSKLEKGDTKLSVERLFKIAKILEVKEADLLGINIKETFNQENKEHSTGYLQKIENFYQDNIDAYESHIITLKEELSFLHELIKKN